MKQKCNRKACKTASMNGKGSIYVSLLNHFTILTMRVICPGKPRGHNWQPSLLACNHVPVNTRTYPESVCTCSRFFHEALISRWEHSWLFATLEIAPFVMASCNFSLPSDSTYEIHFLHQFSRLKIFLQCKILLQCNAYF